jgi:pyruvate kinase
MPKRTKIVCTIGPACESVEILEKMVAAGMNVARLNFSHGTYENHSMLIKNIREVSLKLGEPIALLQDLQGPKIRVGKMPEAGVEIMNGTEVVFDTSIKEYAGSAIPLDYEVLHTFMKRGERLLIADGKIETHVTRVEETKIYALVVAGGVVGSHKGLNVPDTTLSVRAMTEKDKQDAKFGVEQGVDFIALSFVRSKEDIVELRELIENHAKTLEQKNPQPIHIIAKIERPEAVKNIESLLDVVDGIMVARGDLGIEIRAAEVPIVQKQIITLALKHAKPVIVATQMLDSMEQNIRPTRAEVSDVANAVIDHTDAVMLSNESATGKHPVEAVTIMAQICEEIENSDYDNLDFAESQTDSSVVESVIGEVSRLLAERTEAKLILACSLTGRIGRIISSHRGERPLLVVTPSNRVQHQLNLSWGVIPFVVGEYSSSEEIIDAAVIQIKKVGAVQKGDEIIIVSGVPGKPGEINRLEVKVIS